MKKNKSKEAKFFCESCGSEVPRNSRVCTTCGRFFASVRCPKCGRTGTNDDFKDGCPTCGYAVNPDSNKKRNASTIQFFDSSASNGNNNGIFSASSLFGNKSRNTTYGTGDSSLPIWVYVVTTAVLISVAIGLYSCL